MEYSSDMDRRLSEADAFSRELAGVEREVIAAFAAHFNGKPGQYVPKTRIVDFDRFCSEEEIGQTVTDAIESTHDYDGVLPVFHAMLKGSASVDDYRQALVRKYLDLHAHDVAQVRSGIEASGAYQPPAIPQFLREASHV